MLLCLLSILFIRLLLAFFVCFLICIFHSLLLTDISYVLLQSSNPQVPPREQPRQAATTAAASAAPEGALEPTMLSSRQVSTHCQCLIEAVKLV